MSIVVAYIPTPRGTAALTAAVEEARRRGERLLVVNHSSGRPGISRKVATEEQLEALRVDLESQGLEVETVRTVGLDPAERILAVTVNADASLLVIGMRRRTPVGKLLIGSVAQRILLDAECPVMTVKSTPKA